MVGGIFINSEVRIKIQRISFHLTNFDLFGKKYILSPAAVPRVQHNMGVGVGRERLQEPDNREQDGHTQSKRFFIIIIYIYIYM